MDNAYTKCHQEQKEVRRWRDSVSNESDVEDGLYKALIKGDFDLVNSLIKGNSMLNHSQRMTLILLARIAESVKSIDRKIPTP